MNFGFVKLAKRADAEYALHSGQDMAVRGSRIKVNWAKYIRKT